MEDTLVTFKTAKLAKDKGFNLNTPNIYNDGGKSLDNSNYPNYIDKLDIPQPTQSLLQKWLRKIYNIHIKVDDFIDDKEGIEWDFEIVIIGTDLDERGNYIPLVSYSMDDPNRKFDSYEEALEMGLYRALLEF